MPYFVGIDPGLDGGIVILKGKEVFGIHGIPTVEEKLPPTTRSRRRARVMGKKAKDRRRRRYNINGIVEIFKVLPSGASFAVLEFAQAMPGQGVTSQMSIGFGFGLYQGILSSHYIPFEIVHPKRWQKEFSISGDTKSKSFQAATRIFPNVTLTSPRGKILTGLCDAILLAEYARRKYSNELTT